MTDETGGAPAPTLAELRASHAASAEALAKAEFEAANPPLTVEAAQAALATAEAALEAAERPYWDVQHRRMDMMNARNAVGKAEQAHAEALAAHEGHIANVGAPNPAKQAHADATASVVETAMAAVPAAEAAHEAAKAAHAARGLGLIEDAAAIDAAAQGVLDARAALVRAEQAAGVTQAEGDDADEH